MSKPDKHDIFHELLDPAVCRMQFPDGSVPGNAKEAAEGWKKWADHYRDEFEKIKRNQNLNLAVAVEFGYKACEKGNNIQLALHQFFNSDCVT